MRKKISGLSLIVLSILTACSQPITSLNTTPTNNISSIKVKTSIIGKAEFPSSNKLSVKATLNDIGTNATISLIYPTEHSTLAHKTIATGLTDANGNFIINLDTSFTPTLNELFVLEASKRTGSTGTAVMTVRTFIKWNGTSWNSITTPNILINTKTTALSAMTNLLSATMTSHDTIGTISVSGNVSTPSDVSHLGNVIIHANAINSVSNLVDFALSKNYDSFQYLTYQNGKFALKSPNPIVNTISTFAGGGATFADNVPAKATSINQASGLAFDNLDNLYFADTGNNRIRKIDKNTGIISTVVGTGTSGSNGDGGQASLAQLNRPNSITFDSNNNLYVADTENSKIRKVNTSGVISTVVGTGVYGFNGDGGQASNAELMRPTEIAFDNNGNMYFADFNNKRVRKVDNNGIISTFAGSSTAVFLGDGDQATNAQISPAGLIIDNIGNIYIADSGNNRIRKIDRNTGIISTFAGKDLTKSNLGSLYCSYEGDGGTAVGAHLCLPSGIQKDSFGNIYIVDSGNNKIRKVDTNGIISTFVGGTNNFSENMSALVAPISPRKIAFDSLGNMYISSEDFSSKIFKISITPEIEP